VRETGDSLKAAVKRSGTQGKSPYALTRFAG
jgi:hypothetical protein